jgi:diguanylate cyclase (GGDEF)-like protein/PAS domain S-box-containing protein
MNLDNVLFNGIIENLHDGLYLTDTNRVVTYWNKGAERISGFTAAEVVGRSCADNILTHVNIDGKSLCKGLCPLAKTIADATNREAEVFMHHKDGHRIPVLVRTSPLRDKTEKIVGGIELFTDLTNILAHNIRIQELEKLALLDNLTQLANRRYLEREIENRFGEMQRHGVPFAVLFIDIDHFKRVNDTYGHDVGDRVLQFVATTLVANSRPFDLYGRWGGEEFIGVIRNIDADGIVLLGNRMRMLVEHSYLFHNGNKLSVNVSLGATLVREDDTLESLIKRADILLYESKRQGRNRLTFG